MTGRKLRPEEQALWKKVADRTQKMQPAAFDMSKWAPTEVRVPDAAFSRETIARSLAQTPVAPAPAGPVAMDKKVFQNLKRGRLVPEGKIDLHGMTLDRAHPALIRFILASQAKGKRLVLVITGKGKSRDQGGPIPMQYGLLKHQVPQWMGLPPLRGVVMDIVPAHQKHGGGGAYYVYLKRIR